MSVERVKGIQIHRPIIYGNSAVLLTATERANVPPDHTHRWTLGVRSAASVEGRAEQVGGAEDLSYFIKRVTFKLHDTYPTPNRVVDKPPFEVTETGWGEFSVQILINFIPEAMEKPVRLNHYIRIHQWHSPEPFWDPDSGLPKPSAPTPLPQQDSVHAWQYDEIVFTDPTQAFFDILRQHPPIPLPKTRRKGVPPNIANPQSIATISRGIPEFSQVMEREEAERLDQAKKTLTERLIKYKQLMDEKQKEVDKLKADLAV
ncbi:yeats-domain-containing protein [Calocera cornea HHB12733]|uniref:Protein AF-9 homolog n=1 Tax=Calocera cornea HHB12733 TaxID=1353952 RepID=A0A165KBS5_9BASI|nr:yeats-domain-containing protein [Calocera cornea HHB12733]